RVAKRGDGTGLSFPNRVVALPVVALRDADVDEALRKERDAGGRFSMRDPLLDQRAQNRERGDDRIAGRVLVETEDVPRVLAADLPAPFSQLLQHVAVADCGTIERDAFPRQRELEAEVRH